MPDPQQINDADFDAQMRGLFEEAEQVLERRGPSARKRSDDAPADGQNGEEEAEASRKPGDSAARGTRAKGNYPSLPQMLRPIVLGLEAMTRATGENTSSQQNGEINVISSILVSFYCLKVEII